jgi:hypothetical protein
VTEITQPCVVGAVGLAKRGRLDDFRESIVQHKAYVHQAKDGLVLLTEITQPCVHTCDGLFICQLCSLPDLLEETDCKEDTPLTLPFASFVSLSQLIIVI